MNIHIHDDPIVQFFCRFKQNVSMVWFFCTSIIVRTVGFKGHESVKPKSNLSMWCNVCKRYANSLCRFISQEMTSYTATSLIILQRFSFCFNNFDLLPTFVFFCLYLISLKRRKKTKIQQQFLIAMTSSPWPSKS